MFSVGTSRFDSQEAAVQEAGADEAIKKATYPWWLLLEELLWLAATMSIIVVIGLLSEELETFQKINYQA